MALEHILCSFFWETQSTKHLIQNMSKKISQTWIKAGITTTKMEILSTKNEFFWWKTKNGATMAFEVL